MSGARWPGACGAGLALAAVAALTLGPAGATGKEGAAKRAPRAIRTPRRADGLTRLDLPSLRQQMRRAEGHDLFIHLWASWCGPCLEELPDIERLARATRARGATFLSVSLDKPGREAKVLEVLHRQAPSLTRFVANFEEPDQFVALFSGEWDGALPALFVYDGAGQLRASFVGALENADIRRMLSDPAPPDPPRR